MQHADIAVALDVPTAGEALALVDAAGDAGTWYKVGSVLASKGGPALIQELIGRGKKVFLDLKWHDIPNTVAGAVASAAEAGVALATVHLSGGRAMVEAAARARGNGGLRLVGVGVLTSLDAAGYGAIVGREVMDIAAEQERLMRPALGLLDGFVCAPTEAARVRKLAGPEAFLVVPGIRPAGSEVADQVRVATPAEAVAAGADLLVIGRPVTQARDPAQVLREVRQLL